MSVSFTHTQIEYFKRSAKQLHRQSSITHSQALDQIALANGFRNWSLLVKHSDPHTTENKKNRDVPLVFSRTSEQMRAALLRVPEDLGLEDDRSIGIAEKQAENLSSVFTSAQNAVNFSIDYMACLLTVPRIKIYSTSPAYWEMRSWLPYTLEYVEGGKSILLNRNYKPVGQTSRDWVDYSEFQHLYVHVTNDLRKTYTAKGAGIGFLFNDGCPPWNSRARATAYLKRLRVLGSVLSR